MTIPTRVAFIYYALLGLLLVGQMVFTIYLNSQSLTSSQQVKRLFQERDQLILKRAELYQELAARTSLTNIKDKAQQEGYVPINHLVIPQASPIPPDDQN